MSIAVSAVIRPSRRLRRLHALLCVLVLAAAAAFHRPVPRCLMVVAVFVSTCRRGRGVNAVRLDISGVGGIRLAVYQNVEQARDGPAAGPVDAGHEVQLLPGSTLWPALLLLRLRGGDGTVFWLPVLPDSVAPDVMRRVALAMRAIAALGPPAA
jgi:toxin CptA